MFEHNLGWGQPRIVQRRANRPSYYTDQELDDITYDEIMGKAAPAVTMGQEIEQFDEWLPTPFKRKMVRKGGHRDLSGPFEWTYGPFTFPPTWLKWLYDDMECGVSGYGGEAVPCRYRWNWRNEMDGAGCGSHVHFRPSDNYIGGGRRPGLREYDYWATLWNTLNDITPYLAPLMCYTPRFRTTANRWATYSYNRYSPATMKEMMRSHRRMGYRNNRYWLVINGKFYPQKPITLELRAPEAHPVMSATLERLISYMLSNVYKKVAEGVRDVSPKSFGSLVPTKYAESILTGGNIYQALASGDTVHWKRPMYIFKTPSRQKKLTYDNGWEFFKEICKEGFSKVKAKRKKIFTDYFTRTLWFVYNEGNAQIEPWENFWLAAIAEDFEWETVPSFPSKVPK